MMKSIAIFIGLVYLIVGILLFVFQRKLIYFGADEYAFSGPTLRLDSENQQIKVHVLNPGRSRAIVYFGGNAEPVIFNQEPFAKLFPDHSVYLVNYRGYGGSSGSPSEQALYVDGLTVFDFVKEQHTQISIVGRSLGSGVATKVAAERQIHSLVLVTPFDSVERVAQARLPIYPLSLLLRDKFNSLQRADKITADTLVLIASQDQIIPPLHSYNLAKEMINAKVSITLIDGADHNNLTSYPAYQNAISEFLN